MLKLKDIKKDYTVGDSTVHALKGVNLEFRETEFVAILGHSGCGKTTPIGIPTATIPLALSFSPTTSSRIRPFFRMSSLR